MFCARQTGWKDAASAGALGISTTGVPIWGWPENFCAKLWGGGGVHSLRKTTLRSLIQSRNGIGYAVAFLPFLMLGETLCDDVNQFSYKNASLFICFFCFLFAFFGLSSYGLCTQNTFKGSWGMFFKVELLLTWWGFSKTQHSCCKMLKKNEAWDLIWSKNWCTICLLGSG